MSPDQAAGVVKYLQENPEAAKAAWQQAQSVLKTPGMANMMLAGTVRRFQTAWHAWAVFSACMGQRMGQRMRMGPCMHLRAHAAAMRLPCAPMRAQPLHPTYTHSRPMVLLLALRCSAR